MSARARRLSVTLIALLALVAASCSGDGTAADGGASAESGDAATPTALAVVETPSPTAGPDRGAEATPDDATLPAATPTPLATPTAEDEPAPATGGPDPAEPTPTGRDPSPGPPSTPSASAAPARTPTPRPTTTPAGTSSPERPSAPNLAATVVERLGHDPTAFTQGLEFHDGRLFESRGRYGASALTEIDPVTGAVLRRADYDERYFAEGITVVDDRIIVLTWREERAFVHDLDTFAVVDEYTYRGEGWGLCLDESGTDRRLVMSNGSDALTFRDPQTFAAIGSVNVTLNGSPLPDLNELECVDGLVWANVWLTDSIVVIDPASGVVVSVVDAQGLLTPAERRQSDVLNGIARDPDTGRWLITGKLWPAMFVVDFVPT